MAKTKEKHFYWLAYPCEIEKVEIVRKGKGGRELLRDEVTDPYVVQDEDGEQFVVDRKIIYDSPVAAVEASAAFAQKYEVDCNAEDEDEEDDESDDEEDGLQGNPTWASGIVELAQDLPAFGSKRYLSDVHDAYVSELEGELSWEDFSEILLEEHRAGTLRLARADLSPALDREKIRRSEIAVKDPWGGEIPVATFHFLELGD